MLLENKVCIVTGGGSGIGEVTAKRFASEGAEVIIADIAESDGLRVAQEIKEAYGPDKAIAYPADVSSEKAVRHLVENVIAQKQKIDVLCNNAATILPKELEEVTEPEWTKVMDVNLKSAYLMTKFTIAYLRQTKGAIVNMASLNGLVGQRKNPVYASAKGGMIAMTKALALDYAADGVRVNCICPAGVSTPLLEQWVLQQADPNHVRQLLNDMHPLGRPAESEEIADAALFLASRLSRFITGVALPVDGGASLGY